MNNYDYDNLHENRIALEEDRSTPSSGKLWLEFKYKRREVRLMKRDNILAQDEGDAGYLNTRGTKGNRWKHFGNQGRQSDT